MPHVVGHVEEEPVEEPLPEEPSPPGLLDPIREKGVLQGGLNLANMMIPGAWTGMGAAQRTADDTFSTQDLFATMKDFGTEVSFGTPVLGEAQGFRYGLQGLEHSSDWLTKTFSYLGIATPGISMAGVVALPMRARAAALKPGARAGQASGVRPVMVRTTRPDVLSRLSGTHDHVIREGALLVTTTDRSQQIVKAIDNFEEFSEVRSIVALRKGILGRRNQHGVWVVKPARGVGGQVEGFVDSLGTVLVREIADYAESLQEPGMDLARVKVAAVAYETSKLDAMVRTGRLTVDPDFQDVGSIWEKMTAGKLLTDPELNALTAGIVEFADVTMGGMHPELVLSADPRFYVSNVHLGGKNRGVTTAHVAWEGLPSGELTPSEITARIGMMSEQSPAAMVTHHAEMLGDFFEKQVAPHWEELQHSVVRYAEAHPALSQKDTQMVLISDLERLPSGQEWRTKTDLDNLDKVHHLGGGPDPEGWGGAGTYRELVESIRDQGIKKPVTVRWRPEHGYAVVVNGHHRIAAAKYIGLDAVPVEVSGPTRFGDPLFDLGGYTKAERIRGILKVADQEGMPNNLRPSTIGLVETAVPGAYRGIIPEPARQYGAAWHFYQIANEDLASRAQFHGLSHERLVAMASLLSAGELWEQNIDKAVVATLWLRENPKANTDQFMHYMNSEGLKVTPAEAANVADLQRLADNKIEGHFYDRLGGDRALKQPNFVMALLRSDPTDEITRSGLAYALYKGQIPATDVPGLFRELDFDVPVVVDRHILSAAMGFTWDPGGAAGDAAYRNVRRSLDIASVAIGPVNINGVERLLAPSELQAVIWMRWREWRGLTQGYKGHTTDPIRNLGRSPLHVAGFGPNHVYKDTILNLLRDPLPQQVTYGGIARQGRGVYLTPDELLSGGEGAGRRFHGRVTPKGKKPSGKPSDHEVHLSMTEDGLHPVRPPGSPETLRNLHPSHGHVNGQQILRPSYARPVASVEELQNLLLASVVPRAFGGKTQTTGFQNYTAGHFNPLLEDGRHITLSAARLNPDGSARAVPGHRELINALTEQDIGFTHRIEAAHRGPASVWVDEYNRPYWDRREVIAAGYDPDVLPRHLYDEGDRIRMVLSFDTIEDLNHAMVFLQSPTPHHLDSLYISRAGVMGYQRAYGQSLLLRPVKGVKKQARMGTLMDDPVAAKRTVFDPEVSNEVAALYEAAPVRPSGSDVRATERAYRQFEKEVATQYRYITEELGVEIQVVDKNPYSSPREMVADITENNRLKVLSTESTGGHPAMSNATNDMFRAVHDFFGHAGMGNSFTRHGETVAYLKHAQMFSELARGPMFSETRGQTSALIARGGDFAPQKQWLPPKRFWSDQTLYSDGGFDVTGSSQGRQLDTIYGEEVLDLIAYTNGDMERPHGTIGAFEHQWQDPSGQRLVHLSADADQGAVNNGRVWVVEPDGLWTYFSDGQVLRHQPGAGATGRPATAPINELLVEQGHKFTPIAGQHYWDAQARVVNPEGVRGMPQARHIFDVKIDGRVPDQIAMYIPEAGAGTPEIAYNMRTIPGRSPARTVVLTKGKGGSFRGGVAKLTAEVSGTPDGRVHSNLVDDVNDFLYGSGWLGEVKIKVQGT